MRKSLIMIMLTALLPLAGCSSTNKEVAKQLTNETTGKFTTSTSKGKQPAQGNSEEMKMQKLELDHILISLPNSWNITKGLDSASFQVNRKAIGGLDGLGYSDSIESLLPNQSTILKKQEIADLPFKAYSIILQRDTTSGENAKEIHILYMLPEKKIAYDLHFDLAVVNENDALKIAKTAILK